MQCAGQAVMGEACFPRVSTRPRKGKRLRFLLSTTIDMTGPPTPPITSAIEIEDAARAAQPATETTVVTGGTAPAAPGEPVAPQVAIAETPQQAATPYRQAFATIVELATAGKFGDLVEVAETADLTVRIAPLYPGHLVTSS